MVGAALVVMIPLPAKAQVLAPPSLPGQDRLGEQLVRAIETKNMAAYATLLSDDVLVFEDGKEVARGKADWLNMFRGKLSTEGVSFKILSGFSSTGRLLFIEYFNSAGSWGGDVPAHCCWSYDAVAYDVAGGKVTAIRRLRGGNMRLDERGKPINSRIGY
jgi:hypothetical protein